tara:strand:+ start:317 stop:487 length:171 start_codon:yes stop_codon:yes gene_type:complete
MANITKGGKSSTEYTPKKEDEFLTDKQKRLPPDLKRKIIESRQSGAGYSGTEDYKQ